MEKSAISILQEKSARKHCTPEYELVLSKQGTHQNQFMYRVQCGNAISQGKIMPNKKAAKTSAAEEMLKLLEVTESIKSLSIQKNNCTPAAPADKKHIINLTPARSRTVVMSQFNTRYTDSEQPKTADFNLLHQNADSSVSSSRNIDHRDSVQDIDKSSNSSHEDSSVSLISHPPLTKNGINYIGRLQELCVQHKMPDPEYAIVSMSGQSHQMLFTMRCKLGSICEEASALTKKQAKHDVACKVYHKLIDSKDFAERLSYSLSAHQALLVKNSMSGTQSPMNLFDIEPDTCTSSIRSQLIQQAKESYKHFTHKKILKSQNDIPISLYHLSFKMSYHEKWLSNRDVLLSLQKQTTRNSHEIVLKRIRDLFDIQIQEINILVRDRRFKMIGFKMYSIPAIFEIGVAMTVDEAKAQAIEKIFQTIFLMLK